MRCNKLFLLLIVWRISSVFIVQTTHVPDEYWQSLEVAHKIAFGYGYLTWEWSIGIRSYLYPFLISILYFVLNTLKIESTFFIVIVPRIFQALLAAYADYKFYTWTGSKFALLNLCINWYWYYCATRTLINSFETCLTIIALSEYPWKSNSIKNSKFLWIVGFLCFARPTAAIIWLPLCLNHIYRTRAVTDYLLIGIICLIISTSIDILCYGKFVITPFEFFKINVWNRISEQYGKMHLLWYFFSGLPVLLGLNYAFLPIAIYKTFKNHVLSHKSSLLIISSLLTLCVYSLIAHKEFRFILPILPMLIYIIDESIFQYRISLNKNKLLIVLLITSNLLPGLYFSIFHQQGASKVIAFLKNDIESTETSNVDILLLTTCHTTPHYSHLHKNVPIKFLTCEPNLENVNNYLDETDQFFLNPMKWLETNYLNKSLITYPKYVVAYDTTVEHIKPFLKYYKKLTTFEHNHFPQQGRFNEFIIYKHIKIHG